MIERKDLFHIPFYKKTHFSGSYFGMRYRIEKKDEEDHSIFFVTVFPGPYCYDTTVKELMTSKQFAFSEEGLDDICNWLNEQYKMFPEKWEKGQIIY